MIVEVPNTEIVVEDSLDASVGSCEVEVVDLADLDVTVSKKEYVITGDEIYIPMLYDDAPQWMKDLVQVVVDVAVASSNQGLVNDLNTIVAEFATSYVPLNQYTQSIVDLSDEDGRLNALIETLNSNFSDGLSSANAQIASLQLTKASKDEVVAQVIQTIAAQLADNSSNIGATIGRIDQAIADETSARASSFEVLTSSLEDTNLDVTANATATSLLNTYVGLELGAPNGTGLLADVVALASDVTTLSTELDNGTNTWASADSTLENSLMTEISDEGARVESKFAYNSILNINGIYKKSGFGLSTNYTSGSGTQANPYVSEFWIDASRFKFTNSNATGSVAPFTIDATGATPQITFNGKVSFSNVTNVPQLGSTPQEVVTAINNAETTTISGPRITTGSITAAQISSASITADRLSPTTGSSTVWDGGGLVSANFNGNVTGNIGSPTAGFRLSSNAAGTSIDPTIYGAYIKGATLEGTALTVSDVKVKAVGYVNNFGPLSLSHKYVASSSATTTYATSDIFYGRDYSSGYLSTRMCPSTLIFTLTVTGSTWINTSGDMGSNYVYIQVSVNGGAWTTIYTSPALRMQLGGQYDYTANTLDNIQFRAYINNTYSSTKLTIVELDIQATNYGS